MDILDDLDMMMEGRESARVDVSELLCILRTKECECRFGGGQFQELAVEIENISEKGACIIVTHAPEHSALKQGDKLDFVLKLGKRYMTIGAELKWVSGKKIGLYFEVIAPSDYDYISTLIKAYNIQTA